MIMPPMLSYAQNAEDVVLRRAFINRDAGFYIDVGAGHPVEDSVTHHFYKEGWRGINIEPDVLLHGELTAARPQDTNLCLAVGRDGGEVTFYPTGTRGHGTLSFDLAAERTRGTEPRKVLNLSLREIFEQHAANQDVHFLKIDVESAEEDVIASGDFSRYRPHVVVVEAVDATGHPSHTAWEPLLFNADYIFALFDGLNRFYCSREQAESLLPLLSAPANIFDNYRFAREVRALEAEAARADAEAARANFLESALTESATKADAEAVRANSLETALTDAEARAEMEAAKAHDILRATIDRLEQAREKAIRDLQAKHCDEVATRMYPLLSERDQWLARSQRSESALAECRAAHDALKADLRAIKSSPSWRFTKPLRAAETIAVLLRRGG